MAFYSNFRCVTFVLGRPDIGHNYVFYDVICGSWYFNRSRSYYLQFFTTLPQSVMQVIVIFAYLCNTWPSNHPRICMLIGMQCKSTSLPNPVKELDRGGGKTAPAALLRRNLSEISQENL